MSPGVARRVARRALLLPVFVLHAACVRYQPVAAPQVDAAASVRLLLSERGRAENATRLAGVARSVDGSIVRLTADSVVVKATVVKYFDQNDLPMQGSELAFSRSHVASVAAPRVDRKRTTLVVAVALAAATAAMRVLSPDWFVSGRTQGTPPPR